MVKNAEQIDEDGWQTFLRLCSKAETPERFQEFFDLILTIEEKNTIATRALIIKALLEEKESQRQMSERLKVSISKITRGSNAIKIITRNLKEFLKNHMAP